MKIVIINSRANLGALESKMHSEKFAIIGKKCELGQGPPNNNNKNCWFPQNRVINTFPMSPQPPPDVDYKPRYSPQLYLAQINK